MIASLPQSSHARRASAADRASAGFLSGIFTRVARWVRTYRHRRELASLSDYMLKDVGLVRADVERELLLPFWEPIDYDDLEEKRSRATRSGVKWIAPL